MILKPSAQEVLEVRQFFGLPSVQLVEKDWQVVQAMRVILAIDATPFRLTQQKQRVSGAVVGDVHTCTRPACSIDDLSNS